MVAAGGRYSALLSKFEYPGSKFSNIHGVGVNIALSKMISKWATKYKSLSDRGSQVLFRPRSLVLISAHGSKSDVQSEKLKLLNDLWSSNISAELSTNESLLNETYMASQAGDTFLLIFKSGKESIKVKNLFTKTEIEGNLSILMLSVTFRYNSLSPI